MLVYILCFCLFGGVFLVAIDLLCSVKADLSNLCVVFHSASARLFSSSFIAMSVESDSLLTVHVAACPASVCQRSPLSSKSACHISQVHDSDRPLTHLSCVDLSCVQTLIHVSLYPRLYVFLSAVLLSVPFLHCTVSVTIQAFQLTVDRVFYRRPSACLKCNTCCCPLLVCRSSRCTDCIGLE